MNNPLLPAVKRELGELAPKIEGALARHFPEHVEGPKGSQFVHHMTVAVATLKAAGPTISAYLPPSEGAAVTNIAKFCDAASELGRLWGQLSDDERFIVARWTGEFPMWPQLPAGRGPAERTAPCATHLSRFLGPLAIFPRSRKELREYGGKIASQADAERLLDILVVQYAAAYVEGILGEPAKLSRVYRDRRTAKRKSAGDRFMHFADDVIVIAGGSSANLYEKVLEALRGDWKALYPPA